MELSRSILALGATTSTGASEEWSISIPSSGGSLEVEAFSEIFELLGISLAKTFDFPVATWGFATSSSLSRISIISWSSLPLGGELRRGGCPPVDFRARGGIVVFGLKSRLGGGAGGGPSLSESDEISIISLSKSLGFAGGAGGLLDGILDGGMLEDLFCCDEDPASDVDDLELVDAEAFCSELNGRAAFRREKARGPFSKALRGTPAGGAMDEDVLARAEIEVPSLEILEGPAIGDEAFEAIGGALGTAITISAFD